MTYRHYGALLILMALAGSCGRGSESQVQRGDTGHVEASRKTTAATGPADLDEPLTSAALPRAGEDRAFFTLTIKAQDEASTKDVIVTAWSAITSEGTSARWTPASTQVTIGPLPPGRYRFEVTSPDLGSMRLPQATVAAGQTVDLGVLELHAPGRLRVVFDSAGYPSDSSRMWWHLTQDGESIISLKVDSEGATAAPVSPGSYLLRGEGFDICAFEKPVEVSSGRETVVAALLSQGASRWLSVRVDVPLPEDEEVSYLLSGKHDGSIRKGVAERRGEGLFVALVSGLGVGEYMVEVRATTAGLSGSTSFDVRALTVDTPFVMLTLQ